MAWRGGLLCCALVAGCAGPPQRDPLPSPQPSQAVEPTRQPRLSEAEYQAQKLAALDEVLVRGEPHQGLVFQGKTEYVYLSDFQFDPSVIRFKAGTITRVRLSNIAWVTHYFGGEEFFQYGAEIVNILGTNLPPLHHIPVPPLSNRDVYLFIKDPGEYPLSCFVPTHRRQGMTGTLVVEP